MGFDKLIDVILQFIDDILPFKIVNAYNEAVMLRFGKIHKLLKPGFHWKVPFVDNPIVVTVVTTTLSIPVQSIITKDAKEVAVKSVVKYKIDDAVAYIEEIYDARDAISDITQGITSEIVNKNDWEDCLDTKKLSNQITTKVRSQVRKYGILVESITVTDFVKTFALRSFGDKNTD